MDKDSYGDRTGDSFLGNWGIIHFIENNGMAFGMEMGGKPESSYLSIFRIVAIFGIGWFLRSL